MLRRLLLLMIIVSLNRWALAAYPQTTIRNGVITAKLYLPDVDQGYYRGTRFDWSGVIFSLTYANHEYFGEWQSSDDPYLHDRITGPVNSFEVDTNVAPGQTFLRIGVGVCQRVQQPSPDWKHPFRVINHGRWTTTHGANWVESIHTVDNADTGQAYHYTKRVSLTRDRPELVIEHALRNTGTADLESEVYNHNFFVIDQQPTGPDFVVRFPFQLTADDDLKRPGLIRGNELTYERIFTGREYIITLLSGFRNHEDDHQFVVENRSTKAGVRMVTDRPMSKLRFWSPRTTVCPEPFIALKVKPDHLERWTIRYTFYTLEE